MKKNKIETIIKCPECNTKFEISDYKRAILQRLNEEMDYILQDL